MTKLIKTDIGLVDISDVINVTVGDYETPFETMPTICLHKKGIFWNKKNIYILQQKKNAIKYITKLWKKLLIDI